MKTIKPANRRNFLLAAGLGSAGVAAAVVTAGKRAKAAARSFHARGQNGRPPHVPQGHGTHRGCRGFREPAAAEPHR